jgi:choline monooxygenase
MATNNMSNVVEDIKNSETLPATFYRDNDLFEKSKDALFISSWQWIGDESLVPLKRHVHPFVLLDSFISEPLLLVRNNEDEINCLSNVCTHRANLVIDHSGKQRSLTCAYHGRNFDLDGEFQRMPGFEDAENFPRACDNLRKFTIKKLGPHLFLGLDPSFDINLVISEINKRIGFLPLSEFKEDKNRNKEYLVNCHWALYCDNYLEGFHIPFVHEDLNQVLDYDAYESEIHEHMTLQVGYSDSSEDTFDLPEGHVDYGKNISAYYFWIFPNMMFNFYPWGLSVNVVKPLSLNRTKVAFYTYVYDETKLDSGAGALLDKVEREDEYVVESVQKGLQSRFYKSGRFSPTKETGVHYFHQLLAKYLGD